MAGLDRWLAQRSWLVLSVLFLVLAFAKGGFAFEVAAQEPQPTFPYPQPGLTALSFGLPALVWILHLQGHTMLIGLLVFVLVFVGYGLCAWLVQRSFSGPVRVVALVFLGLGPTMTVLLGNIGRHDFLVIYGGILLGMRGYRWWGACVSTLLMILGNPEQAVVALLIALLLSNVERFRQYRPKLLLVTGIAIIVFVILELWARSLGIQGRLDWFGYHFKVSLLNFFGNTYLSLFAGYSLLWVLVLWSASRTGVRQRTFVIVSAIVIPILVTVTTADQTRVFVGVSTALLFMLVAVDTGAFTEALSKVTPHAAAWAFTAAAFVPALDITYRGFQRIPYQWMYDFFVSTGLIHRLGQGPW